MRHFTAMPDTATIIEAAIDTTMRPIDRMPAVISAGYQVVANVAHAMMVDAGAVYYIPHRHTPHGTPKPGELVVVTASWTRLPGGAYRMENGHRVVQWCSGLLGEVAP